MTILLSYQGMIQSIFVGSSTFSIQSTCASTHIRHRLTKVNKVNLSLPLNLRLNSGCPF